MIDKCVKCGKPIDVMSEPPYDNLCAECSLKEREKDVWFCNTWNSKKKSPEELSIRISELESKLYNMQSKEYDYTKSISALTSKAKKAEDDMWFYYKHYKDERRKYKERVSLWCLGAFGAGAAVMLLAVLSLM